MITLGRHAGPEALLARHGEKVSILLPHTTTIDAALELFAGELAPHEVAELAFHSYAERPAI